VRRASVRLVCLLPLLCAAVLVALHPTPYFTKVATFVGIGTLYAMSLNMIWGFGGQFSMGQMVPAAIGAYVGALSVTQFGMDPWLSLLPALAVAACFTLVLGAFALRLRGFHFSIVTLAFAQILLLILYNADIVGGPSGMVVAYSLPDITVFGRTLLRMDTNGYALFLGVLLTVLMLVQTAFIGSRAGRAIIAVREEEILARSIGIAPTRYKIIAFLLSSVPAVLGGWLSAPLISYLTPTAFGGLAGLLTPRRAPRWIRPPLSPTPALAPGVGAPRQGALLTVEGLTKRYAGLTAVSGVTLTIGAGQSVGLIGPNGAGKTTLFDMISGFTRPSEGVVRWLGVAGRSPEQLAATGMVRTFQHARLFPGLTVAENLLTASHLPGRGLLGTADATGRVAKVLELCRLKEWAQAPATQLPYGVGKRLGVALGLITEPLLLMLDEPAAGLTSAERQALAELLDRVGRLGVTLLVIEHDIAFVAQVCRRVVVLAAGEVICDGSIADARANQAVIEAYLGVASASAAGGNRSDAAA
jgi:ABC-type branched-subunit amino acid transport system ATPase component/ABC-type branched-subunit amino acid transport system permease subunit